MRLGAPVPAGDSPEQWIRNLKEKGYRAAYCPVSAQAPDSRIEEYRLAAKENDIVIAEVGAWVNNPLSEDPAKAEAGIRGIVTQLELADKIGARCCVNVAGSVGEPWDGPDPRNLTPETFERLAAVIRRIVDAVNPTRTTFALEPMAYMFPTSPEEMVALQKAVDRKAFAVHLDVVNMLNSVERYYHSGDFTRRCFDQVRDNIRVVHVKDCRIVSGALPVSILEIPLGEGEYDLASLIACARDHEDPDLPLLLEHLPDEAAFNRAAAHFRNVAESVGVFV